MTRVLTGLAGGWAFTWGFVTLGMLALIAAGMDYHDAEQLVALLAFPLYLVVLCGAIVARGLARAVLLVVGGAVVMGTVAWFWAASLA